MKSQKFKKAPRTYFWTAKKHRPVRILLGHPGEEIAAVGIFLAKNCDKFTIEMGISHSTQNTISRIIARGIVSDEAAVNFHGKIFIKNGARGSQAYLEEKSMLMNDKAHFEVIPALEVSENDAEASHSASVGQLDEDELFYLRSRGISELNARHMLMRAFLWPILCFFTPQERTKINRLIKHL